MERKLVAVTLKPLLQIIQILEKQKRKWSLIITLSLMYIKPLIDLLTGACYVHK